MEKLPVPYVPSETEKEPRAARGFSRKDLEDLLESEGLAHKEKLSLEDYEKLEPFFSTLGEEYTVPESPERDQALRFFNAVPQLSQREVNEGLANLLSELSEIVNTNDYFFFGDFDLLPYTTTREELERGDSVYAKLYRAIFEFSTTETYATNPRAQALTRELENIIDQNPQMVGPVAMWQIAKDYLWRRDIPVERKSSLMGSMTYDLAFHDAETSGEELLKQLDLSNVDRYAESAHLLEAVKQFWNIGQQYYAAENGVPDFYMKTLSRIAVSPESNYLLATRAQQILSTLEHADPEFPVAEPWDLKPFLLAKGLYASAPHAQKGLTIAPQELESNLETSIQMFDALQSKLRPPQALIDAAIERGDDYVEWTPPQHLVQMQREAFEEMHAHATVPVEDMLGTFASLNKEEKQELIFDYEHLVSRPMRELISREFGVTLSELTLREQFYFLNYLKRVTVADADAVKAFTEQHGTTGLRTFLSLERGGAELGDQIIAFGGNQEVAGRVFAYYGELLDSADSAEQLVQKLTACSEEECIHLVEQVRENILNRAQKDLEHAVRIGNIAQLEAELDGYNAHAKEYVALLQEVGEGNIETRSSQELSETDRAQMRALLQKNYQAAYPGAANYEFREAVAASLENAFYNPDTVFRVLKDGDAIVSFNRFDTITGGDREITYFGSFNAAPAYSGVGGVMLEATLGERLEDGRPMMAQCDPASQIAKKYIEYGFVATHHYYVAGRPSLEIWNIHDISQTLKSKSVTKEALLEHMHASEDDSLIVRAVEPSDTYSELTQGYGLTRYFIHEGAQHAVFEKLPPELGSQFVDPRQA